MNGKILPKLTAAFFNTLRYGFCCTNAKGTTNCTLRDAPSEERLFCARQSGHGGDRDTATQNASFTGSTICNGLTRFGWRHALKKLLVVRAAVDGLFRETHHFPVGLVCNAARLEASRSADSTSLPCTINGSSASTSGTTSAKLTDRSRSTANAATQDKGRDLLHGHRGQQARIGRQHTEGSTSLSGKTPIFGFLHGVS